MGLFDLFGQANNVNPVGGGADGGILGQANPLTQFGLDGRQNPFFHASVGNAGLDQMNLSTALYSDPTLPSALRSYGQGNGSLNTIFNNVNPTNPMQDIELNRAIATDPMSGTRLATDQVQQNPILSQLYGKDGSLARATQDEQNLGSRGFSLQPEDYEAYGQASDNIARQYGQEGNSLAQALAGRGMASGANGAAGVAYSGLAGNKTERLAQSQMQIAQQRMQTNMQRLSQTRDYINKMGGSANTAINDQYNRNMQGADFGRKEMADNANAQNQQNQTYNSGMLSQFQDQRGSKNETLGQGLGNGMFSSSQSIGAAPGTFASSFAGAGGSAVGKGVMA